MLLVAGLASQPALARIAMNTIDATAIVEDGRHLLVTGPLECDLGERVHVLVTVTQRTTGAVAQGRGLLTCTGVEAPWSVEAEVQGRAAFSPGEATAVAIAWTVRRGVATDAHQWLVPITLIAE
jgi:hypothetical protein